MLTGMRRLLTVDGTIASHAVILPANEPVWMKTPGIEKARIAPGFS
jgi:hypothetical protein